MLHSVTYPRECPVCRQWRTPGTALQPPEALATQRAAAAAAASGRRPPGAGVTITEVLDDGEEGLAIERWESLQPVPDRLPLVLPSAAVAQQARLLV